MSDTDDATPPGRMATVATMKCFACQLRARWLITCRVPTYGGGSAQVDVPVCWWHRLTLGSPMPSEISRRRV